MEEEGCQLGRLLLCGGRASQQLETTGHSSQKSQEVHGRHPERCQGARGEDEARQTSQRGHFCDLQSLGKKRNFFRRWINTHRQEWVTACGEVTEAVSAEKEKRWTEFVDTLESSKDYKKTWGILGSISGKPDSCCPNEAIRNNCKVLVSNESKADAFAAHYAKVSKLEFSRGEWEKNRLAKIRGNAPSVDDSSTAEFSIEELNRAIKKMRKNGAAGPDDIPPAF